MEQQVEFLICGAQKAGTTALADYVNLHPDLHIPRQKEIHFFDNEDLDWENTDINQYHNHFRTHTGPQHWGEATPIYMYWDRSPKRIWRYNPGMRIVVVLRNPITRAYSHWAMETERGAERLSFDEAIKREEERCREALPFQHRVFSYCDRGYYCAQLRRLWHFFGREAVLVLRQEDLHSNPEPSLAQLWRHLGVGAINSIQPHQRHLGRYPAAMADSTKAKLKSLFQHEIHQLEDLLNWKCSAWLEN